MSSDTPTPLVAVLRHNFKQKFPAWRVQGDAADEIERLTRELAEARAEIERMKIDAGKAYCVYCGTSGPKADIWKHVTVCDKHPLKTMADKMEEASGMIQVAMLIFDELGLSGDATAVTAVESIQKLKAELAEYRAATDPHYVDELAALKAENERMREALETIRDIATGKLHTASDSVAVNKCGSIAEEALASRGRENPPLESARVPRPTPSGCSTPKGESRE